VSVSRAQLKTKAESWAQDDAARISHADPGDLGTAIDRAVELYNQDRPRIAYATSSGDAATFDFAVPSGWVENFSHLKLVETPYPPAGTQRERNTVYNADAPNSPEEIEVLKNSSGVTRLVFRSITPESGTNNILWVFTTQHTVHASTPSSSTIPANDVEALGMLVAAFMCEMLASKYAETSDVDISTDVVDYRSKSAEYERRGKELKLRYEEHLGRSPSGARKASGGFADWDIYMQHGRDRLFHRARER